MWEYTAVSPRAPGGGGAVFGLGLALRSVSLNGEFTVPTVSGDASFGAELPAHMRVLGFDWHSPMVLQSGFLIN